MHTLKQEVKMTRRDKVHTEARTIGKKLSKHLFKIYHLPAGGWLPISPYQVAHMLTLTFDGKAPELAEDLLKGKTVFCNRFWVAQNHKVKG